jgi:PTS system nitrogen regulatory IIA component
MALNLDDAARLLGVSPATLRRWAREGQLGVLRPSGDYRFDENELRSWARSHGLRLREGRASGKAAWPTAGAAPASEEQPLTLALARGGDFSGDSVEDRDALLHAMVSQVPLAEGADRAQLLSQLLEREALTSTGLGEGFAVPHPRTPSTAFTPEPIVMLALPRPALDWGSLDGEPVHAVFLLVNPTPQAHLKVLSRLAFVLRDPGFASLLREGASFEEVLTAAAQLEPRG